MSVCHQCCLLCSCVFHLCLILVIVIRTIYIKLYTYIYMFEAEMLDGFGLPELDFGLLDCSCVNNYTHKLAEGEQNMRTHT